jgi:hypothetical protein
MAKYLDGIQETVEYIPQFVTVASGTITVGTNQYPSSGIVNKPSKVYKNYILAYGNKSGQTINSVTTFGFNQTPNTPLPNTDTLTSINLKSNGGMSVSNNTRGALDLTQEEPNPFVIGNASFTFNLAGAPTSGTIDWALIGY